MSRRKIIPYDTKLKEIARNLRKTSTLSEILLWRKLKGKQMKGYDFHRQKPLDRYIVDFFCYELMLAIEIDGVSHKEKYELDIIRQKRLEAYDLANRRYKRIFYKFCGSLNYG